VSSQIQRIWRVIAIALGAPAVLIALFLFVPISPAMIYPLYWQLAAVLVSEPLVGLQRANVTDKVCPMVTQQSVSTVAWHNTPPVEMGFAPEGYWVIAEPKSLFRQCRDSRIRHLSFRFDPDTGQCSAEARDSPTCDF
jgi:hypothetical protein